MRPSSNPLVSRTPEEVVLQAHNALNTHDISAFLDAFAKNLKVYEHPNTLLTTGRDTFEAQYRPLLENATTLHARLHSHTTIGTTVTVHETLYGLPARDRPLSPGRSLPGDERGRRPGPVGTGVIAFGRMGIWACESLYSNRTGRAANGSARTFRGTSHLPFPSNNPHC